MRSLFINLHTEGINLQNYLIRGYNFTEVKAQVILLQKELNSRYFFHNYPFGKLIEKEKNHP